MNLVEKIADLWVLATHERSHHYVAATLLELQTNSDYRLARVQPAAVASTSEQNHRL